MKIKYYLIGILLFTLGFTQEVNLYRVNHKEHHQECHHEDGNSRTWERAFPGVIPLFKKIYEETDSDHRREYYMQFMRELPCSDCEGERLNSRSRNVKVKSLTLGEFNKLSIQKASEIIQNLKLTGNEKENSYQ